MNAPTSTWKSDVAERFDGIFDSALMDDLLTCGEHMVVPA